LSDSKDVIEATGTSEAGLVVGAMPSPASVMPPLDDNVFEGAEENRSKSVQVTMPQSTEVDAREDQATVSEDVPPSMSEP
jgi:hypothetical protein